MQRWLLPFALLVSTFAQQTQPVTPTPLPPPTAKAPAPTPAKPSTPATPAPLSNNHYYTNSSGNRVHSPAKTNGSEPAGASAQCRDGSYSFSPASLGNMLASWRSVAMALRMIEQVGACTGVASLVAFVGCHKASRQP
jgi:hypothetical protein